MDTYGLDCVVNNAGILRDVIFHKMREDDWDCVVTVMLKVRSAPVVTPPSLPQAGIRQLRADGLDRGLIGAMGGVN